MQRSRAFFLLVMNTATTTSCLKRFDPHIDSRDIVKYVITGQVIKGEQIQHINISKTAALSDPWYEYKVPVTGCSVIIIDNKGNMYSAWDMQDGNYNVYIPENYINIGSAFKVAIFIANEGNEEVGEQIVSDYDTIQECADVDSVYYKVDQLPSPDPYTIIRGLRFYCDINAKNSDCRNFRWEATETWEYHAIFADDYSRKVCWTTGRIKDIFTLSTRNLSKNKFEGYPFHFVDNYSSQRLMYGYSLLIQQYSLSDPAYQYWENIRINNVDLGGMYEKQPLRIKGIMYNVSDTSRQVLGFFGASDMKSKRIFVKKVSDLIIKYLDCEPVQLPGKPANKCIDCLSAGGANVKPDFWPY